MLKFDIESKAGSQVQQVDQAELYLPTESELQMAQVGLFSTACWLSKRSVHFRDLSIVEKCLS